MDDGSAISILFADIAGSTRLYESCGDVVARRITAEVLNALDSVASTHGGRKVKTIGDEIMCVFPDPHAALSAACAMQRRISGDQGFAERRIGIRIGVHHGAALAEDADVYGDAVNVAARMTDLAKAEQIVATASAARLAARTGLLRSHDLGETYVAGKRSPIAVVEMLWREDGPTTTVVAGLSGPTSLGRRLILRAQGRTLEVTPASPPLCLGREPGHPVVVERPWVSRHHAVIEHRRSGYVLTDTSTNGTFVTLGDESEFRLHRDELLLRRGGALSLGRALADGPEDVVRFDLLG